MKKVLYFSLLVIIAGLLSCNKEEMPPDPGPQPKTELPPATKTGANTFGFVLNDTMNWVSELFPSSLYLGVNGNTDLWANYFSSTGLVRIKAKREYFDFDEFEYYIADAFFIEGYYRDGNFEIDYLFDNNDDLFRTSEVECRLFRPDSTYNNQLTITHLDTINQIISGTFDMQGITKVEDCSGNQIAKLSDGRFDIKY